MSLKQSQSDSASDDHNIESSKKHLTILVTGASGFIGSHLVDRLISLQEDHKYEIRCMTRNPKSLEGYYRDGVRQDLKFVCADASKYSDLVNVMTGVDLAFYLIHSMEASVKDWKKFADRDRIAASNFAAAATQCRVQRITYLGGLVHENDEQPNKLSEHVRSRLEVGQILTQSTARITIFRAHTKKESKRYRLCVYGKKCLGSNKQDIKTADNKIFRKSL